MKINLSKMSSMMIMLISIIICISSNSWIIMWMMMEINMFTFIPLINKKNLFSSESMMKYFIIQTISSLILFLLILIMWNMKNNPQSLINLMNLCLLMKLGSAPFHLWYIQIIESLNWMNFFILSSLQKIIPLILLNLNSSFLFMIMFMMFNFIMSAPGGMNQNSLKKILGYSSVNHLGWMILTISMNEILWYIYTLMYFMIIMSMSMMFNYMNSNYFNQMFYFNNFKLNLMLFSMSFLSLGGIPPFLMFYPKWMTFNQLINNNQLTILMIMIMSSLTILYFYIQPSYTLMLMNSSKMKWFINMDMNNIKFMIFNFLYNSNFLIMVMMIIYI
uniref:NADH-ubiquinone oxidoreductase chain 2 n=1 Tax=Melanotrichia acclivopennis TaxID=2904888 RepID=A0A9E8LP06_9NEOP|nr:NADH dehydrogenase subunit 2 [Melanotrichia acclivopennis]UZZ44143.1 NADH dehydrogenase subunit 2 [Melanotrichia acclivopennis]